ncbi:MAG: Trm112 family protein [Nanoarchaeota archaeon]|nr:Trm112 family protein [Nanoarchaeota archaeon]
MNNELLKLLACPHCKGNLKHIEKQLQCTSCRKKYQIKNGVPSFI